MADDVFTISDGDTTYKHYLPDHELDYVQKFVRQNATPYELDMLRDMATRLHPGDIVFDIGANVGNHTLYLASRVGCHVVAFEPNTHLAEAISQSARLNNLSELITVKNVGVGDRRGNAHFVKEIPENLGGQSIEMGAGTISVIPLDSLKKPAPVRMLKIDVEGFEIPVLRGAKKLIARDRPVIYAECQNEAQFREVSALLLDMEYLVHSQFNATPTHLFIPAEQTSLTAYSREVVTEKTGEIYRLNERYTETRGSLVAASNKYYNLGLRMNEATEAATQKDAQFRETLAERDAKIVKVEQEIVALGKIASERDLKIASLAQDSDKLADQLKVAAKEAGETRQLLQIAEAAKLSTEQKLEAERSIALTERSAALAERNAAAAERNAAIAEGIVALERQNALQRKLETAEAAYAAAQSRLSALGSERDAARAQADAFRQERDAAQAEIDILAKKSEAQSDALRKLEDRLTTVQAQAAEDLSAARAYALKRENVALGAKRRMELELQAAHAITRKELNGARRDLEKRQTALVGSQKALASTRKALSERASLRRHFRLVLRKRLGLGSEKPAPTTGGSAFAEGVLRFHDTRVMRALSDTLAPRGLRRKFGNWLRRRAKPHPPTLHRPIAHQPPPASLPGSVVPAPASVLAMTASEAATPDLALPSAKQQSGALGEALAKADFIVLVNAYPAGDGAYGGEFIRTRVDAYAEAGLLGCVIELNARNRDLQQDPTGTVPVFRMPAHEAEALARRLSTVRGTVLVHSPSPQMQQLLPQHIDGKRLVYWFHGFELRDIRRLSYNFTTEERETRRASLDLTNRQRWEAARATFANPDIRVIFVSDYLRGIAGRDVGSLPTRSSVIHNFIDGDYYSFVPAAQRGSGRILLLRPFKQRNYAGDIATRAVKLLSDRPGFERLSFTIRGFGPLYAENTEFLRGMSNVTLQEQYSSRDEMKALYASHDIALCPTRHDTQGVSLGEAMARGMACISNDVTGIPEFAGQGAAVLVRPDDVRGYADAIWDLAHDKQRIGRIGAAGAERVRRQCGLDATIRREIALLRE
ncbi:FkbM family methyltransferase [Rhodobacter sp. 24-YEA-8]|uniref:FkbM family methyltransferase n=1 Tax=Rhodobacter sp. 24-YEA-8 TaxID=1884310 RepID=UPI0008982602|nr:FkbM family methyltransferase [Rhodobacter sp. 24-YEA-8]SEC44836.1 methyltransferase, FkbM family [Rhodobacter sp. 24-YEA-8]